MVEKFKKLISSRGFLIFIIMFFSLQAVWYAASIRYKIPPDEAYHFQFTDYYSEKPILTGPIISDQDSHFILGDIERSSNYLYHYTLSFPLRLIKLFSNDTGTQVFLLRLLNILFVLLTARVLYKIFLQLNISRFKQNIVFALLTLTGMIVWMSAAINYDNLAFLTFFCFIYFSLKVINRLNLPDIILMATFATLTLLIKISFGPILLMASLFVIVSGVRHLPEAYKRGDLKFNIAKDKLRFAVVLVFAFITVVLFLERFGGNFIKYGSATPACTTIHAYVECSENGLVQRAEAQGKIIEQLKAENNWPEFNVVQFTSNWSELMYGRIFFYFGHKQIQANQVALVIAFITLVLAILIGFFKSEKLFITKEIKFIWYISFLYVLILYLFNMNTVLANATQYGFQGRYLLPVLPFLYLIGVLLISSVISTVEYPTRAAIITGVFMLGFLNLYHHAPPLVFLRGTDDSWYTRHTVDINKRLKNNLKKVRLVEPNSLRYTN